MKLIDAIKTSLEANGPMNFAEIAKYINENSLYVRADNKPVPVNQVIRKVRSNPDTFAEEKNMVLLYVNDIMNSPGLSQVSEPHQIYGNDEQKNKLDNLFKTMLDILWTSNFRGSPEHHLSALYFFAAIPVTFWKKELNLSYKDFRVIYSMPKNIRISEYVKQLEILNEREPFQGVFSIVLSEKDIVSASEETYNKLFFLINEYEVDIWKDPSIGGWLTDFVSAYSNSDYKNRIYSTPDKIRLTIRAIVNTLNFKSLYDPAAGTGSLVCELIRDKPTESVYCQEINDRIFPLLKMNLISNFAGNLFLSNKDSLRSGFPETDSVDLIVSDLPWEIYKNSSADSGKKSKRTEIWSEELFIEHALDRLCPEGKAVLNVSHRFLNAPATVRIRKKLSDNDLIETIVTLPSGLYKPFSNARSAIIIITKRKDQGKKNKMFFIDLDQDSLDEKSFESIRSTIFNWQIIKDKSTVADLKRLAKEEYSFLPSAYLTDIFEYPLRTGERLVVIDDILKDYRGTSYRWEKNLPVMPFIKVSTLSGSVEEIQISVQKAELTGSNNSRGMLVDESVIMLSRVGEKLKPQYFEYTGSPVVINHNILAFTFNSKKYNPDYLIYELRSKFFEDQLKSVRRYSGIPNFSRIDFKKLFLRVPERIRDQEIKVMEQKELYLGELEAQLKIKREKLTGRQKEFDLVSTIKHNLVQKLSVLNNDLDFISDTIKISGADEINVLRPLSINTEESLLQILSRMRQMVNDSNDTLLKTENYIRIASNDQKGEILNVVEFLEKKVKPIYTNQRSFKIFIDADHQSKVKALVNANSFQLKELFTNFIQNAIDHGFVDENEAYEIRFLVTLDFDREMVKILISNNGFPLPEDFTIDTLLKFGEKAGESGGTGIGGAVIGKIIESAGGEIRVVSPEELFHSKYAVNFEICLPLTSKN
jgi:type I restriction enzyme M protein